MTDDPKYELSIKGTTYADIDKVKIRLWCDHNAEWTGTIDELCSAALTTKELLAAIDAGELDISQCMICHRPVVCIPDGLPMCRFCAAKEGKP
jgi:hypothetical protein